MKRLFAWQSSATYHAVIGAALALAWAIAHVLR